MTFLPAPSCMILATLSFFRGSSIHTFTSTNRAAPNGKALRRLPAQQPPGGITTLVDMPLNCVPETINVAALEAKRNAARGKAWVDWAAWGGVVRGNSEELQPLVRAGVPGFKCFLIHSGIDGFAWVNEKRPSAGTWEAALEANFPCWHTPRWPGRWTRRPAC